MTIYNKCSSINGPATCKAGSRCVEKTSGILKAIKAFPTMNHQIQKEIISELNRIQKYLPAEISTKNKIINMIGFMKTPSGTPIIDYLNDEDIKIINMVLDINHTPQYKPKQFTAHEATELGNSLAQKYPGALLKLKTLGKYVIVDIISVKKEERGKGVARNLLTDLTQVSDQEGFILALTPSNVFGSDTQKLSMFYETLGFKFNEGNYKDYGTRERMIREPQLLT